MDEFEDGQTHRLTDRLIDWFHEAQTGHGSVGQNDFGTMPEK